jgi:hypothetical protein
MTNYKNHVYDMPVELILFRGNVHTHIATQNVIFKRQFRVLCGSLNF